MLNTKQLIIAFTIFTLGFLTPKILDYLGQFFK